MSAERPIIVNQAEVDWESWDDLDVAARSPVRWKLLIAGERGPSRGLEGVATTAVAIVVACQGAGDIVHRVSVSMSLTKNRFLEMAGWAHVGLSATV